MKRIYSLLTLTALLLAGACSHNDSGSDLTGGYYEGAPDDFGEKYTEYGENNFIDVSEQPVSTFAVDCDGASYSNMRRWLNVGQTPPKASVRIEEFLNYFTFDYPEPQQGHNVSMDAEVAACPWNSENLIMRLGLKGRTIPQAQLPATNYVFLIDVSGSMNYPEKLGILKTGFTALVDVLGDNDKVAIVTYAGSAGVALKSTNCDEKDKIKKAISKLSAGGSTAGADGIVTAYKIAKDNFVPDGNNRIIIGSDGDFNVGMSSTEELVELIEEHRDMGIYLTVLGVGSGNLNDGMMEQLANKGNGTYEYIDNEAQMEKVFIRERSKFYTIAKDCKVQVAFDPALVSKYRLIGYENRSLDEEDFEDDKKDAGDIGVGQTVTAIYEIVPAAKNPSGKFATFDIRYKKPGDEQSVLLESAVDVTPVPIASASANTRFAAAVASFGMLMKESEFKGTADKDLVLSLGEGAAAYDPNGYRSEFLSLVRKAKI